ncbi:MAG: thermonuclease family protein [Porphyrobacter sp.]|nr:thermonuclease family protein [Porphyrobacter sp.]
MDAPELQQICDLNGETWLCGEEASRQLADIIGGRPVACAGEEQDQYGRLVAVCSSSGVQLNKTMVETGWATAFRKYSQDYVEFETRARAKRPAFGARPSICPSIFASRRKRATSRKPAKEPQAETGGHQSSPAARVSSRAIATSAGNGSTICLADRTTPRPGLRKCSAPKSKPRPPDTADQRLSASPSTIIARGLARVKLRRRLASRLASNFTPGIVDQRFSLH